MGYQRTLRRSAAVAVLCVSGAVAAFATIAPVPEAVPPIVATSIENLPIDVAGALLPAPATFIREERVQRGDTLTGVLARLEIGEAQAARLARLRTLQQLRPGHFITADVTASGELRSLAFLNARDMLVQVQAEGDEFKTSEEKARFETRAEMKAAVIRSSLFAAADASGIPDSVAMQLADVFGGDIDFHRDLRKGDRLTVVYDLHHLNGRPVRAGRMLAAEFVNNGRTFRAVFFNGGYYAPDGKAMRKAFLRSPLEFSRVTSGFGMRHHPIMKSWRAHKGIDYAAPIGTRVRAVGDGVVEFAGAQGGYGNVVILRHQGQYTTIYAHLSRIAAGVRKGARVAQADTVGLVGQTGWATGPHLHYEFRIAGEARNPLAIALPAAHPVAAHELPAFRVVADPLVAQLDLLVGSSVALLQ
jgi:murein DD-endopeptidase MepM/ murein hydrolase activator NlpD